MPPSQAPTHAPRPAPTEAPTLHVAAGVVHDGAGRVLIAKRPGHVHQGGLWEFPGGKLEPGETVEQALCRELREELDIETLAATPLIGIHHHYPERRVRLEVWRVEKFEGQAKGMQDQPIRWVTPDELPAYEFPAANRPIVAAARLPDHYAILDADSSDTERLRDRLHRLADAGVGLIRLRASRLDSRHYAALAEYAAPFCRARRIDLLLNGDPALVRQTGAAGLHLRADQLLALRERPLEASFWVAASCHSPVELRQAERIGADFAVLSPVQVTATHPEAVPLGWAQFAAWVEPAALPVYALGGLTPADTAEAKWHGAQGIAAIRGFLDGAAL
ncbi:Nudix family hydrolase [Methylomagnum sp.]